MNSESKGLIDVIVNKLGLKDSVIVRDILIGKENFIHAVIIYVESLTDENVVDERILKPLMSEVDERVLPKVDLLGFICQKYITRGNTSIESDMDVVVDSLNHGKTAVFIDNYKELIIVNTKGGEYRSISEPENESQLKGTREGFVENVEVNISMMKRLIKDRNLKVEKFKVGRRSKSDAVLMYIEDIADPDLIDEIRQRIKKVDVDIVESVGVLEQHIEDSAYSPFPQVYGTERPDKVVSKLMEGRAALILSGTPYVITMPAVFIEFMQTPEDYYERTVVSSFVRVIRFLAISIIIFMSPIYLTLISYNVELIPVSFIIPIAQSRQGIPLPPFFEILIMEIVVELLREGGLRLPPKIAQTISIVGGIIIGNAAVQSKVVSPTTILIVGISTVASFLIPNYEMAVALRFIRFPLLVLADALGFLGIAIGCFFLITHMFSLKSFNVPYLTFTKHDMEDMFIRYPLWMMRKRPDAIPNKDSVRIGDSGKNSRGSKNE